MDQESIAQVMTTSPMNRIQQMMQGYGQEVPLRPVMPSEAVRRLRVRLLLEEVLELADASGMTVKVVTDHVGRAKLSHGRIRAWSPENVDGDITIEPGVAEPDLVMMADALADIDVVNRGAVVACGLQLEPLQVLVDENNLLKIATGTKDAGGKLIKHPNHPKPDFAGELQRQGWVPPANPVID